MCEGCVHNWTPVPWADGFFSWKKKKNSNSLIIELCYFSLWFPFSIWEIKRLGKKKKRTFQSESHESCSWMPFEVHRHSSDKNNFFFSLLSLGSGHTWKKISEWSSPVFDNVTKSKSCQTLQYLIQHAKQAGSNFINVYESKWFYFIISKISLVDNSYFFLILKPILLAKLDPCFKSF